MRTPLEDLERRLLLQAPALVRRTTDEQEGPMAVALVERILASTGENAEVVFTSTQWAKFRTLYPVAAARLEKTHNDGIENRE